MPPAPTYINASQPSRAAPLHSTVASFGKKGIEYRKVSLAPTAAKPISPSIWPSLNEANKICEDLKIPKTAKNLKTLEAPSLAKTIDPVLAGKKAKKLVDRMVVDQPEYITPRPASSSATGKLAERLSSPLTFGPTWADEMDNIDNYEATLDRQEYTDFYNPAPMARDSAFEETISLGGPEDEPASLYDSPRDPHAQRILQRWESPVEDGRDAEDVAAYDYFGSDDEMELNHMIETAAGLSAKAKGKQKERQVLDIRTEPLLTTLQCTRRSTSLQEKEESLDSNVEYSSVANTLVNVLNKIELHTQKCEKCKHRVALQEAWILDSGASQHFTNTKDGFLDFEVVRNAPEVNTASANAKLRIEGKGTILLSHLVEDKGSRIVKTTRIYPVLYIPGLSVKLLSMGGFLQNEQEVRGNANHITFFNERTRKAILSAYPTHPRDTIYWVIPQKIDEALIATIYKVDYNV